MEHSIRNILDQVKTTKVEAGSLRGHIVTSAQLTALYNLINDRPTSSGNSLREEILTGELARLSLALAAASPDQKTRLLREVQKVQEDLIALHLNVGT